MWNWDQGRLEYFQFDNLRKIAKYALAHDLKAATHTNLQPAIGLPFSPVDPQYLPWRNYSRTFKLSMLVSERLGAAQPTPIAVLLANDGKITTDEYFHFLAQATTDPSPALQSWDAGSTIRYPLLFALKYVLTRAAVGDQVTPLKEIVEAYAASSLTGDEEDQSDFLEAVKSLKPALPTQRQAIESLRVLAQISYLSCSRTDLSVSLDQEDAADIFKQLTAVGGVRLADGNREIERIAAFYPSATADLQLEYSHTVVNDAVDAGFAEGNRVEKTHLRIERNSKLRKAFFDDNPSAVCDFCGSDTQSDYPWAERVLDVHHLLPLCSGTRTTKKGTALDDLVANCPTCHRAVHRYYGKWLKDRGKKDFSDAAEARSVYDEAKNKYAGK